jgi:hypothetical protein
MAIYSQKKKVKIKISKIDQNGLFDINELEALAKLKN